MSEPRGDLIIQILLCPAIAVCLTCLFVSSISVTNSLSLVSMYVDFPYIHSTYLVVAFRTKMLFAQLKVTVVRKNVVVNFFLSYLGQVSRYIKETSIVLDSGEGGNCWQTSGYRFWLFQGRKLFEKKES